MGVGVGGGVLEDGGDVQDGGDVLEMGVMATTAPPEPPRLLQELDQIIKLVRF